MIIVIPMAGEGQRFRDRGYTQHKPTIMVTSRKRLKKIPMIIAAIDDVISTSQSKSVLIIDRDFHKQDGVQNLIQKYFDNVKFITLSEVTDGQARTCLKIEDNINNKEEVLISACDNGMDFNLDHFNNLKKDNDCIIFTFRNNPCVENNPNAYGWLYTTDMGDVIDVSIKKSISSNPMEDHAITGTFWFRSAELFIKSSQMMIEAKDKVNNEYYIDQAIKYCIKMKLRVKVFEVDRYICWGTPDDYECYENTISYWRDFLSKELIR